VSGQVARKTVFAAGRRLVGRRGVHVQNLLNYIVNFAEHENAHLFLPLGRREQNDSRDHCANVNENAAKFAWRARLEFYGFPHGGCPFEHMWLRVGTVSSANLRTLLEIALRASL
jgi:hypothetical protein